MNELAIKDLGKIKFILIYSSSIFQMNVTPSINIYKESFQALSYQHIVSG